MAHSSHTLRLRQGLIALMILCLSSLAGAQVGGSVNRTTNADRILFDGSIAPGDVDDLGFNDPDADDQAGGQRLAEDFSFTGPVIVSSITFLGGYFPSSTPKTDSFTLTIYNDNMGLPDPLSIVTRIDLGDSDRTDTGTDGLGIDLYTYTASFAGVSLTGDTRYWLTIVNHTTDDTNDDWVWAGKHEVGNFAISGDGGLTWLDTPAGSFSFLLGGTAVPEPSVVVVNNLVTFEPETSTYSFTPVATGCPAGFVGIFSFDARLTNISDRNLADLQVEVAEITDGNLLLAEESLLGEGERFSAPQRDGFTDALLSPGEVVDVPFAVCLQERRQFKLFVDVFGTVLPPVPVVAVLPASSPIKRCVS